MMTVNEVCTMLDKTEDFLKARQQGNKDEETLNNISEKIVEFEKSCIECGMDAEEEVDTVTDIKAYLIADVKFWRWLEEKGLEYVLDVHKDIPSVLLGDEIRIRQIILNLTNNAIKYTAEGRVSIHIGFDRGTNKLTVRVADTGMGIRPEELIDGVEIGGVGTYLGEAEESNVNLFI